MRTAHAGEEERYGYGLTIEPGGFGHGGDMLGYVSYLWADTDAGLGAVALANGFGGAWDLGEGALAVARGEAPPDPALEPDAPLVDDGSCPPAWAAYPGRYRAHNPWLPTFAVAARDGGLVLGTDWVDLSERLAARAARRRRVPRRGARLVAGAARVRHGARRPRAAGGPLRHAVLPRVRLLASVPATAILIYSAITGSTGSSPTGTAGSTGAPRRGGAPGGQRAAPRCRDADPVRSTAVRRDGRWRRWTASESPAVQGVRRSPARREQGRLLDDLGRRV